MTVGKDRLILQADMAELADAEDLKSSDFESCGFKSHYPHCLVSMTSNLKQQIESLYINEGDEMNEYIKTII